MYNISRVCIIEDDPIHLLITKKVIEKISKDITFIVFTNGKQAFDELRLLMSKSQEMPQILLLDLHMPVWDGWQFLEEFLKLPGIEDMKIYLLTSSENPEDLQKARELRLHENYLIKPLQADRISEIIHTAFT